MKTYPDARTARLRIAIILLIAFFIRFGLWTYVLNQDNSQFFDKDTSSYIRTAQSLLYGSAFSVSPDLLEIPETIRTPGYPLYLAASFAMFGENIPVFVLTQLFLSLGTIAIVYWMVHSTWGNSVATISALLLAFDIPSITFSLQVLSETLFTFLITAMIAAGVAVLKNPKGKLCFLLTGVFLSTATMVRPISYYLVIPLGAGLGLWMVVSRLKWRAILSRLLLFGLPFLIIVGGWQARNKLLIGDASVSQIEALNMLAYRAADIIALRDGTSIEEARQTLGIEDPTEARVSRQDMILAEHWRERGLEIIKQYPWLFLRSSLKGLLNMILGPGEGAFMQMINGQMVARGPIDDLKALPASAYLHKWVIDNPLYFIVFLYSVGYLFILYFGVLVWLITAVKKKLFTSSDLLCWGVFFYFVLISAGPEAYYRFRVPLIPIQVIYTAQGLLFLFKWLGTAVNKLQAGKLARINIGILGIG